LFFYVEYSVIKGTVCSPGVIRKEKNLSVYLAMQRFVLALHQIGPGPCDAFDRLLSKYANSYALAILMWQYEPSFRTSAKNAKLFAKCGITCE
jgi:hypothetical protein